MELTQLAQASVDAHADKALPVSAVVDVHFSCADEAYRHAKLAALALGFIEADAQCLAMAWLKQTQRTGHFDPLLWPTHGADFELTSPNAPFAPCPAHLGVYAVLPDAQWVGNMARAGVPTVQLRFKSDDPQAIEREVQAAVQAVRGTPALLFINDHWEQAIAAGAYGVHLGQEDLDLADLDAIRRAGLRLGLSSHGYAEMKRAFALGPSYLAMGAVYPTNLKRMATAPQGPGRLAAYVRLLGDMPGVAIGGISKQEFGLIKSTGVGSVAVVRAITAEADPVGAARALMAAWAG